MAQDMSAPIPQTQDAQMNTDKSSFISLSQSHSLPPAWQAPAGHWASRGVQMKGVDRATPGVPTLCVRRKPGLLLGVDSGQ